MRYLAALVAIVLGALYYLGMHTPVGQNLLLERGAARAAAAPPTVIEGLQVYVCGSASPLPAPGRAQACLAVLTPEHYFVVDAGSGSANNLGLAQLPAERMDGVLLTHFHSDHISDLPGINVQTWASGHDGPLKVYGPPGVGQVVAGFNMALAQDRQYRSEHHGQDMMPPDWGVMEAVETPPEAVLTFGDLTITAFTADHNPASPAVSYRFDYLGRSLVITGDTLVTDQLSSQVEGVDLLMTDALSLPIVAAMQRASAAAGRGRIAKILLDIQEYHASTDDVIGLTESSGVRMTALYHLVPGPRNRLMEAIFRRGFSDNMVLTQDGMWFELAIDSQSVELR